MNRHVQFPEVAEPTSDINKLVYPAFGKQIVNWNSYVNGGSNIISFSQVIKKIDAEVLKAANTHLFQRHQSLRTTFYNEGGRVMQKINTYDYSAYQLDFYRPKSRKSLKVAMRIIYNLTRKKIADLESGPLAKGAVVLLGEDCYLIFMIHHIISDAYSLNLIKKELSILYNQPAKSNQLLPDIRQLKDYTQYQLKHYDLQKVKRYWKGEFSKSEYTLDYRSFYSVAIRNLYPQCSSPNLLLQTPGKSLVNYSKIANYSMGRKYSDIIPQFLFGQLHEKAGKLRISPFIVMLSVLNILFYNLFHHRKIFFTLRMNGRSSTKNRKLIGNLTGAVFLLNKIDGSMKFEDVIRLVNDNFHESSQHIVYNVKEIGDTPIFTGSHLCINYLKRAQIQNVEHLKDQLDKHSDEHSFFPLSIDIEFYANVIVTKWIYNPLIYRASFIEFITHQHIKLYRKIISSYEVPIGEVG